MRLISLCKHVFAIKHYIENEVTLGHNNTCSSKKQKFDVCVYRKSKKSNPPTKVGNVSLAKSHPEYEYDKTQRSLSRKRSCFDPRSPHGSDVSFFQKNWEELAKTTNGTAKICDHQEKSKKSKSLECGISKEKIARKRYVGKNNSSHINFQCQEPGLFISQAYPYLVLMVLSVVIVVAKEL